MRKTVASKLNEERAGAFSRSNFIFLNVSSGKLKRTIKATEEEKKDGKKDVVELFDGYVGKLTKIEYDDKNEYEGKKVPKYKLTLEDNNGETAIIGFSEDTWYYQGFFARIEKVDLRKEFLLGIIESKQNAKVSFCYIKQDGEVVKAIENFPKPTKEIKGKKKVETMIWDDVNERVEEIYAKLKQELEEIAKEAKASSEPF